MKKTILLAITFLAITLTAFSQEREIKEEGKTVFKPHAYLQLQGGAAYTLGEADFMDLISPAAALNLGYQFTPALGMRIGASGWQGKGGWVAPAQVYDFKFVQGNIDLVLNIRSLLSGFNSDRVFNPYLFAGGAYAYGFENGATELNTGAYDLEYLWEDNKGFPGGRFGLGLDFKLSDAVSVMLEGNANMLSDHFNSKRADNLDWQFNALAGFKINLGKAHTRTEPVYYEPQPAPAQAPEPKPEPKPAPKPAPAPVVKEFPALPAIHFAFDSDVVNTQKYAAELNTIVSVLKEFSNTNVVITGYTDHKGSNAYNNKLSLRRAEAVKKYLAGEGISADRLTTQGAGEDPKTSGQEALTIQARRVEVAK